MSKTFYAGTFNPFTIGHKSIVDRALTIFDTVTIGVGYNVRKPESKEDTDRRADAIREIFAEEPRVEVVCYGTLTTEAAKAAGADSLLRGVRNCTDFDYERSIAEVNRRLSGLDTILLFSLPEHDCISSSMVRELRAFGADTTPYLP